MKYDAKSGYNRIRLSGEEYLKHLDPFLSGLGVRSRIVSFDGNDVEIMSENPYRDADHVTADKLMSEDEMKKYKLELL